MSAKRRVVGEYEKDPIEVSETMTTTTTKTTTTTTTKDRAQSNKGARRSGRAAPIDLCDDNATTTALGDRQFDKQFEVAKRRRGAQDRPLFDTDHDKDKNNNNKNNNNNDDDDDVQVLRHSKKPAVRSSAAAARAAAAAAAAVDDDDDDDDGGWIARSSLSTTAKGRAAQSRKPRAEAPVDASAEHSSLDVARSAAKKPAPVSSSSTSLAPQPKSPVAEPPPASTNSAQRGAKSKAVLLLDGTRHDDDDDDFASIERAASPDDSFEAAKKSPSSKLSKEERVARKRAADELKRAAKETKDRAKALKKAQPELLNTRVADDNDDDLESLSDLMTKIADKPVASSAPPPPVAPLQADVAAATSLHTSIWEMAEDSAAAAATAAAAASTARTAAASGGKKAPSKRPASGKPAASPSSKKAAPVARVAAPTKQPVFIEPSSESPPVAAATTDAEVSDSLDDFLSTAKKPAALRPPFRPGHDGMVDVDLICKSDGEKIYGSTDRVMSGDLACERMAAFRAGGRQRGRLAGTVSTGYFTHQGRERMTELLMKRYKTPENSALFGGNDNVVKLVLYVLLPELALTLLTVACGSTITRAQALSFLENPPDAEASNERILAAARGAKSKVAKSATK